MKYKIIFNASSADNQSARDSFHNYITAVRDGLALADEYLGIFTDYREDSIEFEVNVTDNLLELSKDKHFKFLNRLQSVLWQHKHIFTCELLSVD